MKNPHLAPFALAALILTLAGAAPLRAAENTAATENGASVFQIVKATDSRVWRLNRQTGEIAVCTLDAAGSALVCMNSSDSVKPPVKDFATLEAERKAAAAEAKAKRDAELSRDLAFLDRMVESFKSIIRAAMEHDQQSAEK